ncbi:MAG: galactokinase [Bryobacteraceae bacterium]|jgi:galactokinase
MNLASLFAERFPGSGQPAIYRAPGRVNLIGEHTDYNLGFVLPIAIDLATWAVVAPNDHGRLRIRSENLNETREWAVAEIPGLHPAGDWTDYVIGVARQIPNLDALDVLIYSTVPVGAGLSSSAALEVSLALALGSEARGIELAKLARRSENDFVGNPCGIMDQYVSVCGRAGAAIKIDCRSLDYETVTLPRGVSIVVVNTMVKHELSGSAYRDRVRECAEAVEAIRAGGNPGVLSLRDAGLAQLDLISDAVAKKRARHVISEDARVEEFVAASARGDAGELGRLFVASHRSLQHDYEVSCEELDFLVDTAVTVRGVYGARMTGGGFGGCTVNLVDAAAVDCFEEAIRSQYHVRYGVAPEVYRVQPSAGAGKIPGE